MDEWSFDGKPSGPRWPTDAQGEPEAAAFLTHTADFAAYDEVLLSKLHAFDVPTVTRYPESGGLGKVYLGFSGSGIELFVPASRLAEAQALIQPQTGDEPEEEEV